MPSRIWYWLAAAIALAGAAGAALFLMPRLAALEGRLIQVVVPGTADLALERPGAYTIFHEPRSVVEGALYYSEDISGLTVALRSVTSGRDVALAQPSTTTSYAFGGRSGTSVLGFEIAEPGLYRLSAAYADGRAQPRAVLALGQGVVAEIFTVILTTMAIALVAFGVAVAIATTVLLRRRRAIRAARGELAAT